MSHRTILSALLALVALAVPAASAQAAPGAAVVFSKATTTEGKAEGGLFAVRDGRLNQLTENPTDTEPAFAPDGRTIVFARGGDLYSVRPDGSGQRQLTSGPELDSAPRVSPNGKYVVFERRAVAGGQRDLYTVGVLGGGIKALSEGADDDHEASFRPDGKTIVFVRGVSRGGGVSEDLYSVKPGGEGLAPLTSTTRYDEFAPRYFKGGIIYSRGESSEGPAAYADVYTMRRNGTKVKAQIAGVGSAYVEDVSPDGRIVLFRRDQGLWGKKIGPFKARKLTQLPDGSETSSVFSSDGKRVAAFVADKDRQQLVSIAIRDGSKVELAESFDVGEEDGTVLGPVIDWQPLR